MRVLGNDGLEKSLVKKLTQYQIDVTTQHFEREELKQKIGDFDVLVVRSATKVDREMIDCAGNTKLKLIIRAGVGMDNIDISYAKQNGIAVKNTPKASSNAVAELVLAQIFNLARFVNQSNLSMREGQWNKKDYVGIEVSGKTLGIIGFGNIGQVLAQKANLLGMKVIYHDLQKKEEWKDAYREMKELLRTSDFISLHTNSVSEPIIRKDMISDIKKGSYLINASRGNVIDEEALLEALDSNVLAGAAIDVFLNEPNPNPRICNHPRCSVTPHIGASTVEAQEKIGEEVFEHIMHLKERGVL